jgi:feruloyl esterase
VAQQFTAFLASPTARDSVDPLALSMDALPATFARARAVYDATSPDLRAFKARGGKLLMWHGLADGGVPARASVEYYEQVVKTMGGRANVDGFFRLFLLPGVHHCAGGPGPDDIDTITALENWVEKGIAPSEMITRKFVNGVEQRSRPVYPYPTKARYSGTGDPLKASSFVPSP